MQASAAAAFTAVFQRIYRHETGPAAEPLLRRSCL